MAGITRCLLANSRLPKLVGESESSPRGVPSEPDAAFSAHHGDPTPCARLFVGRRWYCNNIRNIGSRAFVHIETDTNKLEDRPWGGQALREPSEHQGVPHLQRNSTPRRWSAGASSPSRRRRMWCHRRSTRRRASARWTTSASSVFTTDQGMAAYCDTYVNTHSA